MKSILKKGSFGIAVVALAIGAILLVQQRKSELANLPGPVTPPVVVHVARAEPGKITSVEHYLGTIEAISRATISPRVTGHLLSVAKDVGDTVRAGEVVARLDDRTLLQHKRALEAEREGAVSDLELRTNQFKRRKKLFHEKHISEESLDEAERIFLAAGAKVRRIEAEIESAAVSLDYAVMRAPFDGLITRRSKDPGDLAGVGQPILSIEQPASGYKILVKVPQQTAVSISSGVPATLSSGDRILETTVDRVHPAIGLHKLATVELRTHRAPFGLPSGATVGVDLAIGSPKGIRVPTRALLAYGEKAFVFRLSQRERVRKTPVRVIGRNKGQAVIEGPISDGDELVTGEESMLLLLVNGTQVRPVKDGDGA